MAVPTKNSVQRYFKCSKRKCRTKLGPPVAVVWFAVLVFGGSSSISFAFAPSPGMAATPRFRTTLFSSSSSEHPHGSADPIASVKALDALVPRANINDLIVQSSKSDRPGTVQVVFHLSLAILAACIPHPIISSICFAFVSSFFFHGLHETVHGTAFCTKWKNQILSHVVGLLCVRPARHYFYYHWQHHRYTGNPELDSELQPGSFLDLPIETLWNYVLYLSGIPFWIDALSSLAKHAWGQCPEMYLTQTRAQQEVVREARLYVLFYTALAVVAAAGHHQIATSLFHYWLLPAFLGQPFLRFYLLCEHRGRRQSNLIYENTRTMSTKMTNALYRRLAWNMPYHMEHHAWPSVPFYKLSEAHALLVNKGGSELLQQGEVDREFRDKGYIAFHWAFLKKLFREGRSRRNCAMK